MHLKSEHTDEMNSCNETVLEELTEMIYFPSFTEVRGG